MKLFYDHLIDKASLTSLIETKAKTKAEKQKLLRTLDEIVHNTVLDVILVSLDERHHEEFLSLIHETPHSEDIFIYLRQKAHPKIEEKIKKEVEKLQSKILKELGRG